MGKLSLVPCGYRPHRPARAGRAALRRLAHDQRGVTGLMHDQRGVTGLVFAISAVALLAIVGLGSEATSWYVQQQYEQNVADAAAMAGVYQNVTDIGTGGSATASDVIGAALDIASANNFSTTAAASLRPASPNSGGSSTVTAEVGTFGGGAFIAGSAPNNAVKVVVTRTAPTLFSSLFLPAGTPVTASAVGALKVNGQVACVLALGGGLHLSGSADVATNHCALASNAVGPAAISFTGGAATVTGATLTAWGGCTGTGSAAGCSGSGNRFYAPPTLDPYQALQSFALPPAPPSAATCQNMPQSGTVTTPYETSGRMFCTGQFGGVSYSGDIATHKTINLVPGTYILYNAGISLSGNGALTCTACSPGGSGVTIILTGDTAADLGTINLVGNGTIALSAPATSAFNPGFDGVLFYSDAHFSGSSVSLNGNAALDLTGALYFPTAAVSISGSVGSSIGCTIVIGYSIAFTGNSTQDVSGCGPANAGVPQLQSVVPVL